MCQVPEFQSGLLKLHCSLYPNTLRTEKVAKLPRLHLCSKILTFQGLMMPLGDDTTFIGGSYIFVTSCHFSAIWGNGISVYFLGSYSNGKTKDPAHHVYSPLFQSTILFFWNIFIGEKLEHLSLACPITNSSCIPLLVPMANLKIQVFHRCHLKQTPRLEYAKNDIGKNICRADLAGSFRTRQLAVTTSVSDH